MERCAEIAREIGIETSALVEAVEKLVEAIKKLGKYNAPDLSAKGNNLAVETLEITYESMEKLNKLTKQTYFLLSLAISNLSDVLVRL